MPNGAHEVLLTRAGRKQLGVEQESWDRMTVLIALVMETT